MGLEGRGDSLIRLLCDSLRPQVEEVEAAVTFSVPLVILGHYQNLLLQVEGK
tara:strand:- start:393 stop:548 length:156 start_codon:yes stop_codon:yes gene_type:complete